MSTGGSKRGSMGWNPLKEAEVTSYLCLEMLCNPSPLKNKIKKIIACNPYTPWVKKIDPPQALGLTF